MRPSSAIAVLAVLVAGSPRAAPAQTSGDSTALRAFVDEYREVFNTRDAAALALFFDDGADMVMGNAPHIRGRGAIEAWWGAYFEAQEPARTLSVDVASIRLPAPDLGLVQITTTTGGRDSSGAELVARRARGTWVTARRNGRWSILALRALPTERDSVVLTRYVPEGEAPGEALDAPVGIRTFVRSYQNAFNARDPAAVAALYTEDADIVVRNLPVTRGRPAIEEWWRDYYADRPYFSDAELTIRFAVHRVRMIPPEAALIDLVVGADRSERERQIPTREARATWLVVRRADGWKIAAVRVLPSEHDRILRQHELLRSGSRFGAEHVPS